MDPRLAAASPYFKRPMVTAHGESETNIFTNHFIFFYDIIPHLSICSSCDARLQESQFKLFQVSLSSTIVNSPRAGVQQHRGTPSPPPGVQKREVRGRENGAK